MQEAELPLAEPEGERQPQVQVGAEAGVEPHQEVPLKVTEFNERCLNKLLNCLHIEVETRENGGDLVKVSPDGLAALGTFVYVVLEALQSSRPWIQDTTRPISLNKLSNRSFTSSAVFDDICSEFNSLEIPWDDDEIKSEIIQRLEKFVSTLFGIEDIQSYHELINDQIVTEYDSANFESWKAQTRSQLPQRYIVIGNGSAEDFRIFIKGYYPIARDKDTMEDRIRHELEHITNIEEARKSLGLTIDKPQLTVVPYSEIYWSMDRFENVFLLPVVSDHAFYEAVGNGDIAQLTVERYMEAAYQISDPSPGDQLIQGNSFIHS